MPITAKEIAANFPLSAADADMYARRTISSRAFYRIVSSALAKRQPLSAVRMGDGERIFLIDYAIACANGDPEAAVKDVNEERLKRLGVEGMPLNDLAFRLSQSAENCDFFGPNINGLSNQTYSLYPWYKIWRLTTPLVDNFWCNDWSLDERVALLKSAGNALVLHANPVTAVTFAKRARAYLNVGLRHVSIKSWKDADAVIAECAKWDYPLALISAGPGAKWIIPELAKQGKVALDIGNSMDQWLLYELWKADPTKLTPSEAKQ